MSKVLVTVVIIVVLALGTELMIKSVNAACGHEFMNVGICGHVLGAGM